MLIGAGRDEEDGAAGPARRHHDRLPARRAAYYII